MQYNKFVFPAPKASYDIDNKLLILIPKCPIEELIFRIKEAETLSDIGIPCLFFPCSEKTEKILIYFHANAEDASLTTSFMIPIKDTLKCHILVVEYPGYGIYEGKPTEKRICRDAITVFDFLTKNLKISPENISIMGRSMGSGPATHLCSKRNPGNLILVSPYTSIKGVADKLFGKFLSGVFMVKERFKNIEKIGDVKCPVLLIHGKKDQLISYEHSKRLAEACNGNAFLRLQEEMTHNRFNTYIEIVNPIFEFWKNNDFLSKGDRVIKVEALKSFNMIVKKFIEKKKKEEVEKVEEMVEGDCDKEGGE